VNEHADCPFCVVPVDGKTLFEGEHLYAIYSLYPSAAGHSLVIPRRHTPTFLQMNDRENRELLKATKTVCEGLALRVPKVDGWTIGWNCGAAAGQTVMHAHLHIIPRRFGDVENPKGGIRNVLPGGDYTKGVVK